MTATDASPTDFALELGGRLRAARERAGLTLSQVAVISAGEFSACAAGSYERGDRAPTVERLDRLARLYGVALTEILPGSPLVTQTFSAITAAKDAHLARMAEFYEGEMATLRAQLDEAVAS